MIRFFAAICATLRGEDIRVEGIEANIAPMRHDQLKRELVRLDRLITAARNCRANLNRCGGHFERRDMGLMIELAEAGAAMGGDWSQWADELRAGANLHKVGRQ